MRCGLPSGSALAQRCAVAVEYRKHPVSGKTSLVGGAGPHGPPRVSTGVSSRLCSASKTAVFSRFYALFCVKEVLRWLVTSTYFTSEKRIMTRKSGETEKATRNNALETAVRDCRGLVSRIRPIQQNTSCKGENKPSRGRGPPRVLTGPHGFSRAFLPGGFPP